MMNGSDDSLTCCSVSEKLERFHLNMRKRNTHLPLQRLQCKMNISRVVGSCMNMRVENGVNRSSARMRLASYSFLSRALWKEGYDER
jgi:hypothetical protein